MAESNCINSKILVKIVFIKNITCLCSEIKNYIKMKTEAVFETFLSSFKQNETTKYVQHLCRVFFIFYRSLGCFRHATSNIQFNWQLWKTLLKPSNMTLILTENILFLCCENKRAYTQQASTQFQHKKCSSKLYHDVNYTRKVTSQRGS